MSKVTATTGARVPKAKTAAKKPATEKKRTRGPSISDTRIINALNKARGFISIAARILRCSANTIRHRIESSDAVRDAYDEINEANLDLSESKLLLAIDKGDVSAIKFHLEHKGAWRGYAPRHEVEVHAHGAAAILSQVTVEDIDRILALREKGAPQGDA